MDLNFEKEVDEFVRAFKEGGILTRVFLLLGFFLTVSSLTSLSKEIVAWKGFILAGINFYQLYFVDQISSKATYFGLSYSQNEIHTATISSICVTVGMRLLVLGQKAAFRVINKKNNSNLKPELTVYWVIAIVYPIGLWIWYGVATPTVRPWLLLFVTVFYPFFIVIPKKIMSKFGSGYFEEGEFNYFKSYYAYIGALCLVVCVLAAINTAISEGDKERSIQAPPKNLIT